MEEAKLKKLKKLALLEQEPSLAIFDELEEIQENLEPLKEALSGIEFIKGEKGEDGFDGVDGKDGYTPVKGVDYFDGKDGRDGKDGLNGKDGINGKDGLDGLDGQDGKDGEKGEKGDKPDHKWDGTKLMFEKPNGEWGKAVDLIGKDGKGGILNWGVVGSNLRVKNNGTLVSEDTTTKLNFYGTGIGSITNGGDGQVNIQVNDSQDLSDYLKLDQTTPQTTVGTFTFPIIKANSAEITGSLTADNLWYLNGNTLGSKKTLGSIDNQDFGIITNNTERITVLKGGGVGIGTTAPSSKLDLGTSGALKITQSGVVETYVEGTGIRMKNIFQGGGWARGLMTFEDSAGTDYFVLGAYGSGQTFNYGFIGTAYNDTIFRWYPNKNVTFDGNVGIGTTNPGQKLEVSGNALFNSSALNVYLRGNSVGNPAISFSRFPGADLKLGAKIQYVMRSASSQESGALAFWTNPNTTEGTDLTERMRIDSNGNVGIGTTNPQAKLDVGGRISGPANTDLAIGNIFTIGKYSQFQISGLDGGGITYFAAAASAMTFNTSAHNNPIAFQQKGVNRLRIDASGNVGIGTTDPSTKLQVVGEITKGLEKSIVQGVVFTQIADKTIGNTTTETSMFSTGVGSLTIPANSLVAGRTYRIKLKGYTSGTNGDTSTIKVKLGTTELVSSTGTWQTLTDIGFTLEFEFACRTTGATGTVAGNGYSLVSGGQGFSTISMRALLSGSDTLNTTVDQTIDLTYQWSDAKAGNTITITNASVEVLN